jgi:hypothetical protein
MTNETEELIARADAAMAEAARLRQANLGKQGHTPYWDEWGPGLRSSPSTSRFIIGLIFRISRRAAMTRIEAALLFGPLGPDFRSGLAEDFLRSENAFSGPAKAFALADHGRLHSRQ